MTKFGQENKVLDNLGDQLNEEKGDNEKDEKIDMKVI